MDLKNLLPLFMANGKNTDKLAPLIKMMSGQNAKSASSETRSDGSGENSGSDTGADKAGETFSREDILKTLVNNNSPAAEALKTAFANKRGRRREGITPLLGIVNDDILGKMIKYLNRKQPRR